MKKLICFTLLVASCALAGPAAGGVKKVTYPAFVHAEVVAILDGLQNDREYHKAQLASQAVFDQAVLYAPADRLEAIGEADFSLRLVGQLSQAPFAVRDELLPFLRKNENLARTLVFLIQPDQQRSGGVYQTLDKLVQKRGDQLETFSTLAAAISVVQNRPLFRHINENVVKSGDPIDIFDYYVKNEKRMYFGIRNVPADLLIYVVDTTASTQDMEWALDKYAFNNNVGKLFFDIKYDYESLKHGTEKKVTAMGYTLPNILKYGGVCADQAYFATSVGKAIGVPTSYDTGFSATVGHAWVGFLQAQGNRAYWNFNSGRYESYQGVKGTVLDPQTRQDIPDSYVSLLGEMIGTKAVDRQTAVALTDAASRLMEMRKQDPPCFIEAPSAAALLPSTFLTKPRATSVASQLAMIELALHQSVAYVPAWFAVRDLAVARQLTFSDKQFWSDLLLKLGAKKYPDFTLAMLLPMVQSVEDPQQQDLFLTRLMPLFASRLDLSASIKMAEASLWESQNQTNRAGQCYMDVVEHYTNGGPFVISALTAAEKLLVDSNRLAQIPLMYGQAWDRTKKPGEMAPEFMKESNWYQIGSGTPRSSPMPEIRQKPARWLGN